MNHFSKNWLTKTNGHQGDFYTRRLLDKNLYTRGNSNQRTLASETFYTRRFLEKNVSTLETLYNKQLFFRRLLITLQYVFFAWAVGILYIGLRSTNF